MDFSAISKYLPLYTDAALLTLKLGALGILFSIIIGIICSVVRFEKVPILSQIAKVYIEISRNTPLLVQLFFFYFGLPLIGLEMTPEVCGVVGIAFLGGSYMAESFRSGFESVERIQLESSLSLGMTKTQRMRFIIIPQATAISFPSLLGNVIFLLKETCVFSTISLMDLMFTAKDLIGLEAKTIECLLLLVIFYAIILIPISIIGTIIERRVRHAGFGS